MNKTADMGESHPNGPENERSGDAQGQQPSQQPDAGGTAGREARPRTATGGVSIDAARDWPLLAAAVSAFLCFIMLFVPWASGAGSNLNAFEYPMQTTGPALIIVAVIAVLTLIGADLKLGERQTLLIALSLIPASNILVIYIVKLGDVSHLIHLFAFTGPASLGVGLWLGFFFALATVALLVLGLLLLQRSRKA